MSDDEFKALRARLVEKLGREFRPGDEAFNGWHVGVFMQAVLEWAEDVEKRLER